MKKKISSKLSLDKETIARLSDEQANLIGGGLAGEKTDTCRCKSVFNRENEDQLAAGTCCEDSCHAV